jgi:hypothetical protein
MSKSNMTKIALTAAIILSTAFSALSTANAGAYREQAAHTGGAGVPAYDGDGGVVSGTYR